MNEKINFDASGLGIHKKGRNNKCDLTQLIIRV